MIAQFAGLIAVLWWVFIIALAVCGVYFLFDYYDHWRRWRRLYK